MKPDPVTGKRTDAALTEKSLNLAMRRLFTRGKPPLLAFEGERPTPHDLRRTVRTHLSKTLRVPPHVAEKCLNHSLGRVFSTYDQGDYLDDRRVALGAVGRLRRAARHREGRRGRGDRRPGGEVVKVGLTGDDIARVMQALAKKNPKRKSSSFEELYAAINKFIRQECGGKDQAIGAPKARAKRTKKAKREDEKWRAKVEDRRDKRAGTDAGSHRAIAKHFVISRQRVARILASPPKEVARSRPE